MKIFEFFEVLTLKMTLLVIIIIIFVISAPKYSNILIDNKIGGLSFYSNFGLKYLRINFHIFKRIPVIYIKNEKRTYKSILLRTNVHTNDHDAVKLMAHTKT